MSSTWGNNVKISIFGESHGEAVGISIDGLPAGEEIDFDELYFQMGRRAPGNGKYSTQRKEEDKPRFISGILNGVTTGTPICAIINNKDIKSQDYDNMKSVVRPGHADYTGSIRYKGFNDTRGGGHFSGRLTAPLTLAGAICKQILLRRGIDICAHIFSISNIKDKPFDPVHIDKNLSRNLQCKTFPVIDENTETPMKSLIEDVRLSGDSVGGIVECAVIGTKPGIGSPMFDGIENLISSIVFGIPAVKGIEFGNGFDCTYLTGSENNDPFIIQNGEIRPSTNKHGGILGGISSGMPIIFRVAIKPTPSIAKPQQTVDMQKNIQSVLEIQGRHDPCIIPRVVPVIEAATAIAIINLIMEETRYGY